MQFAGSTEINAPRERVWAFVIDPEQVGWCGPGVESIETVDETHFRAKAKVGVGVISARFTVNLELAEAVAPDRAVIRASGQAPGSAVEASGEMNLTGPPDGPTTMDWSADVDDPRDVRRGRRAADRGPGEQADRARPSTACARSSRPDGRSPRDTRSMELDLARHRRARHEPLRPRRRAARARRSRSTPRCRASSGSRRSSPRASGRSS